MSIPVFFLLSPSDQPRSSLHHSPDEWSGGVFFFFFLLYIAPSSICFLLVYKEQLASGGLHFLTSTCVVLFLTHCCYKSAHSVHSYIIYVVCPPCCAFVFFDTLLSMLYNLEPNVVKHEMKTFLFSFVFCFLMNRTVSHTLTHTHTLYLTHIMESVVFLS